MSREKFRKNDIVAVNTAFGVFTLAVVRVVESGYVRVVFPDSQHSGFKSPEAARNSINDPDLMREQAEDCPDPVIIPKTNITLANRKAN